MQTGTIRFTGENFIPGLSDKRLQDDHVERYHFAARFAKGKRCLDIACGPGYGSQILIEAGAMGVDSVDISEKMVEYARRTYPEPRIRFQVGDIRTYRTAELYDQVTCFETIEHLPQYREALVTLFHVLRPGGKLFISSPNRLITTPEARSLGDKPSNPYHTQEFTVGELRDLLAEAGFAIGPEPIQGQRYQMHFRSPWLRKLHRMIFKPAQKSDPALHPLGRREPRYFLIVATKPV